MKQQLLLLFITGCLFTTLNAQLDTSKIGQHFKVEVETVIYPCDITGKQTSTTIHIAPLGASFTYVGNKSNQAIIRFWVRICLI